MEQQQPTSQEEQIRERAYYLWEQATDPKGMPDEYWEQARAEVEKETPPVESGPVGGKAAGKAAAAEPAREPAR